MSSSEAKDTYFQSFDKFWESALKIKDLYDKNLNKFTSKNLSEQRKLLLAHKQFAHKLKAS